MQLMRGRRLALDASATRPSAAPRPTASRHSSVSQPSPLPNPSSAPNHSSAARSFAVRTDSGSTRTMGTGRVQMPKYNGLRGGTQLIQVGDDAWLGVGHDMQFVGGKKHYWHIWYLVDAHGRMTAASEPMKLARNGIEFAAGMGIDGDRVIVSFGVDDMECKLAETSLAAVLALFKGNV